MAEPILEVRDLTFSYEGFSTPVFRDISFSVSPGDIFVILGANGAGKSTLLNCMTGILTQYRGEILLHGRPLRQIPIRERALMMGYVPQVAVPTFNYTVRDYVVMGRAPHIGLLGTPSEEEYARADAAIREMGIEKLSSKLVTRISGGERQQVQIARVLTQGANLIILDEPTNHLDFGNQLKILDIIKSLSEQGLAIILTTHMPDHAILLDRRIGILDHTGHMTAGALRDVLTESALKQLYDTDLRLLHIDELGRDICVAVGWRKAP